MLTDEKKALIEDEERFRHELRQKIEGDIATTGQEIKASEKKLFEKINTFLNSSIGLLLVSSVVVSGGGALYQQIEHDYESREKSKEQSLTFKFEIGDRIKNMQFLLKRAKTVGDAKVAMAGMFKSQFPLNSSLDNKSLSSLYFSLYQLAEGTEKERSKEAIQILDELEELEYSLQSRVNTDVLNASEKEQIIKLVSSIESMHLGAR
ncbi:hypothetical protein [Polynucleobacter sp. es-EL-1]|uniref:hypothetical protein n=1 Tax=Polynucleobacter sp. es-EL-1 TaxID=1855652 RepID=UPI001BFE0527|nr:hypothetical protein [Polynucleobacter sp. es-EL-1]QWE10023.1 hypothetical protein FD974_06635 [Polynucleobacter sp. es-EL-1]